MNYINDLVVKKALSSESSIMQEYVALIISVTTGIPLNELSGNLKLVYPSISYNINTVDSLADLAYHNDTHYFSIEINYTNTEEEAKVKNLLYVYQLTLKQIRNSKNYAFIKPVYQIQINYEDYFNKGDLLYTISMKDEKYNLPYLKDYSKMFIINLSYFKNKCYNDIRDEEKKFFRLFYLYICNDKKKLNSFYEGDKLMKDVKNTFDTLAKEINGNLYINNDLLLKRISFEKGEKKGKAEGKEQVAKNMLSKGVDINFISEVTGLTKAEINKLL